MATVTTEAGLRTAITVQDPNIVVANDITLTAVNNISYAVEITSNGSVLSWGGAGGGTMFSIQNGGQLTCGDIVLDGLGAYLTLANVSAGGTFVMNDGAILRNVQTDSNSSAVRIGTSASRGGTFLMNGGQITGVMLDCIVFSYGGTITMSGDAAITENSAYGFGLIGGVLNMTGNASITNNAGNRTGMGFVALSGAVINMGLAEGDAPRIANNESYTSYCGGGILTDGSILTMNYGATIADNTASSICGGIAVSASTLIMNGDSVISGNIATTGRAGGILGAAGSQITIHDNASVFGNTIAAADGLGGGIFLQDNGTAMTLGGSATVYGNTADYGAGIYVNTGSVLNMGADPEDTPTVTGNTATSGGGGIYIGSDSTANLRAHAHVTGNTAAQGADIYNNGALNIAEDTRIDGLYFNSIDRVPTIVAALSQTASIRPEGSDYVLEANIPVVIAVKGDAYDEVTDTDRAAFKVPNSFPPQTPVYRNDAHDQVLLGLFMTIASAFLRLQRIAPIP